MIHFGKDNFRGHSVRLFNETMLWSYHIAKPVALTCHHYHNTVVWRIMEYDCWLASLKTFLFHPVVIHCLGAGAPFEALTLWRCRHGWLKNNGILLLDKVFCDISHSPGHSPLLVRWCPTRSSGLQNIPSSPRSIASFLLSSISQ